MTITLVDDVPVVVSSAGAVPTPPATIQANLIADVTAINPGFTADLPGSLIEDVTDTQVAGLAQCDQAVVDTINSLTPLGANDFMLLQLGSIYGTTPGTPTNTSVLVVFSGAAGQAINQGIILSDGTYQYVTQEGTTIGSGGASPSVLAIAIMTGSWVVSPATVTTIVTSITPSVTVTNPLAGTPGVATGETSTSYRARTLQAGQAIATGSPQLLKTTLYNVPGVQVRLVTVRNANGGWEVVCGGGDPYAIGNAIYRSGVDISLLVGSVLAVTNITQANPGVVTTDLNHGFTSGQVINIAGVVGMTAVNNVPLTITVLTPTTFSIGVNTSGYGAYISGGVVTPNLRNQQVAITDFPDTYELTYVVPPLQAVAGTVTWNTTLTSFISPATVQSLANPALVSYVNSLYVGQPLNLDVMAATFGAAVASSIPPEFVTRLVFNLSVNGVSMSPNAGTVIIPGDPESYFNAVSNAFTIVQG
jgi:hypothetical protein